MSGCVLRVSLSPLPQKNAERFGFELSFPRGNRQGVRAPTHTEHNSHNRPSFAPKRRIEHAFHFSQVAYEPWHWRFVGDSDSWAIFAPARAYAAGGAAAAGVEREGAEDLAVGQDKVMLVRLLSPSGRSAPACPLLLPVATDSSADDRKALLFLSWRRRSTTFSRRAATPMRWPCTGGRLSILRRRVMIVVRRRGIAKVVDRSYR